MAAIELLQCNMAGERRFKQPKAAGMTGGFRTAVDWERCLFRGNLAWRVECAGIVDLGDLMVAEAEHLAQDLVGMFA
jgi:hypothetical protein